MRYPMRHPIQPLLPGLVTMVTMVTLFNLTFYMKPRTRRPRSTTVRAARGTGSSDPCTGPTTS